MAVKRAFFFRSPRGVQLACTRALFFFFILCTISAHRKSAYAGGEVSRSYPHIKAAGIQKLLPMAKFIFAIYPVRNLPSASETLADGKRFICRRQTKNLQSASAPLAIGKIHV